MTSPMAATETPPALVPVLSEIARVAGETLDLPEVFQRIAAARRPGPRVRRDDRDAVGRGGRLRPLFDRGDGGHGRDATLLRADGPARRVLARPLGTSFEGRRHRGRRGRVRPRVPARPRARGFGRSRHAARRPPRGPADGRVPLPPLAEGERVPGGGPRSARADRRRRRDGRRALTSRGRREGAAAAATRRSRRSPPSSRARSTCGRSSTRSRRSSSPSSRTTAWRSAS